MTKANAELDENRIFLYVDNPYIPRLQTKSFKHSKALSWAPYIHDIHENSMENFLSSSYYKQLFLTLTITINYGKQAARRFSCWVVTILFSDFASPFSRFLKKK